jgi:hypothetical protein
MATETKLTVKIDTRKWVRAGGTGAAVNKARFLLGDSMLMNEKGNKCCLGFICESLGVPELQLRASMPSGVALRNVGEGPEHGIDLEVAKKLQEYDLAEISQRSHGTVLLGTVFTGTMAGLNDRRSDDPNYTDQMRQADIAAYAQKVGIELVFEGPTLEEMLQEKAAPKLAE